MANIHIVTDSAARFTNLYFTQQHPVTIVPNRIEIAGKLYREGVDLSADEMMRLIATQSTPPKVHAPTANDFSDVYSRLLRAHSAIVSIHASRKMLKTVDNALAAVHQLGAQTHITVIDTQTLCAAQGLLVQLAGRCIRQQMPLETLINTVRGAVERVYCIYYVDSLDYLLKNGIMSPSHAILGTMLGIKPFLTIEDGELSVMEKVRTRAQAIERLVEFLVEFTDLEDAGILQHKAHMSEQTRMLQDRLSVEFPGRHFPYLMYSATLASLIGTTATGLAVLEAEMETVDDDF